MLSWIFLIFAVDNFTMASWVCVCLFGCFIKTELYRCCKFFYEWSFTLIALSNNKRSTACFPPLKCFILLIRKALWRLSSTMMVYLAPKIMISVFISFVYLQKVYFFLKRKCRLNTQRDNFGSFRVLYFTERWPMSNGFVLSQKKWLFFRHINWMKFSQLH